MPKRINTGFHTKVVKLQDDGVRDIRKTLFLLWGAVLFVLLIGAVNIAILVLARSTSRMRELATRFALGAGRWRVTHQFLTESVLMTSCGAAAGLCGAVAPAKYIEGILYGIRPLDPAVMASVAAGLITISLGACLVPARRAARVNPIRALRHE